MALGDDGSFRGKLDRASILYAAGFIAFVLLLATLGVIGVPNRVIGSILIGFTILTYVAIGVACRTMQVGQYFVAGREVPPFYNGMATGASWISVSGFLGLTGSLYLVGYDGLAFVLGWTGGFVLTAVLVAPYLRKTGAYTVPDFLAARYDSNLARLVGVMVLLCCSFTLAVAQIYAVGIISARFLGIDFNVAVYGGLGVILLCSLPGGMRGVTWTQVAQYVVLVIACLVPAVWISASVTEIPILDFSQALQGAGAPEAAQSISPGYMTPFSHAGYDAWNYFLLILCLTLGTASLPHLLMRCFTTPSVRGARLSIAWSLLFIVILYVTAPAFAAFARWTVLDLTASGLRPDNIAEKAGWLMQWAAADKTLVEICGRPAVDAVAIAAACGEQGVTDIGIGNIRLDPDIIMLATPEMAGMPYVFSALVAAGALGAALAAASGLLLAMASALGHDLYYKLVERSAPIDRRLAASRIMLVLVTALAAYVASNWPTDVLALVSWAFSLAASGLFPALVLGASWKRTNSAGAVAGMVAGFGVCLYYMLATRFGAVGFYEAWSSLSAASPDAVAEFAKLKTAWAAATGEAQAAAWSALDNHAQTIANWWGVKNLSAAAFGVPVGFLATIVVTKFTRGPSVETVSIPRGGALLD